MKSTATFEFLNADGLPMVLNVFSDPDIASFVKVELLTHGSGGVEQNGSMQFEFQANGEVNARIDDDPQNKIKPVVV